MSKAIKIVNKKSTSNNLIKFKVILTKSELDLITRTISSVICKYDQINVLSEPQEQKYKRLKTLQKDFRWLLNEHKYKGQVHSRVIAEL